MTCALTSRRDDMRAGAAGERGLRLVEVRDDGARAAAFDVADRRLDLGLHAAAPEFALLLQRLQLAYAHLVEKPLARLAEACGDALHRGQHDKRRDAEHAREQ